MKSSIVFFSFIFLLIFILTGCEREEVEEIVPEEPLATEVAISIESADRILVNGEEMTLEGLREYLENLAQEELVHAYIHAIPDVDEEVIDEVRETVYAIEGVEIRTETPEM